MIQSFDSDLLEIVLGRVGPNLLSDKKKNTKRKRASPVSCFNKNYYLIMVAPVFHFVLNMQNPDR